MDLYNDNNENNSSSNNGNKGKFSDRLKKIRRDRLKWRKNANFQQDEDESVIKQSGRNILKIVLAIPSVVYTNVKNNDKKDVSDLRKNLVQSNDVVKQRRIKVNKIRDIDITLLKKKKEIYLKDLEKSGINIDDSLQLNLENEVRIVELQKEILGLIKKKLVKNVNELEVLQSELYLLKELNGDDIYLKDCQEDIKEIKKLLSKIKTLKEKYDYLKDNVDFEYMLEYGDELLIDKILELKELCSSDDIKYLVDNYKILDEYKFLYLKIDKLQENTIIYEEYKKQEEKKLKKRDIDFEKLKINVYDVDKEKEKYESFAKEQERFLKNLEEKLLKIDSHEVVSYRLKGFNKLVGSSFKYLGLLLVNPLKGFIPGIATQTIVTKNLIHNLYDNLTWEEKRKMVYETIDYSKEINNAINNLDDTSSLIESTLDEVVKLKSKYINEFSKYENSISGYHDTIKKINKMENAILGSKIKIDIMKQRMREKERQNSNKVKRVKKLNND